MKSSRPYLLRAFYEWIVDNDFTPYVVVNSELPGVDVPQKYVEDGRIVLNISPAAVRSLLLANDHIEFSAQFSGVPHDIYAPMRAVTAIYAKENGRGMVFKEDEDEDEDEDGTLVLSQAAVRPWIDFSVFIDTPETLRYERRLQRDVRERGRTPEGVRQQFFKQVKPMHDEFIEPSREHADLVLPGLEMKNLEDGVEQLIKKLSPQTF